MSAPNIDQALNQVRAGLVITHRSADSWPRHRAKARKQRASRRRHGRSDPAAHEAGRSR